MKKALFLLLCIIISVELFAVESVDAFRTHEDEVIKGFITGDDYKLYNDIEALLLKFIGHPAAALYYPDLPKFIETEGADRIEGTIIKILSSVENSRVKNKNIHRLLLSLELEKLLYASRISKARELSKKLSPLTKWEIIGPFSRYGPGDLDYVFLPEIITDFKSSSKGEKIIIADGDGSVNFSRYVFPDSGVAYARTSFRAAVPVKIRIYSKGTYKAFVNGVEVVKNDNNLRRTVRVVKVSGTGTISLMIKMLNGPHWDFRVIVTDMNDALLSPVPELDKSYHSEFKFSEEIEYPYNEMKSLKPEYRHRYLGFHFDNLSSRESLEQYRLALKSDSSSFLKAMYSLSMMDQGSDDRSSANYSEGWRIISEIAAQESGFAPAAYRHFISIKSGDRDKAYMEGKGLIERFRDHIYIRHQYLSFLRESGYEKEFINALSEFRKRFPRSVLGDIEEAEFYRAKDKKRFIQICGLMLKKRDVLNTVKELAGAFSSIGEHYKALELIYKYGQEKAWQDEVVDILIRMKDFSPAKHLILEDMMKYQNPSAYYRLGYIEFLKGDDPYLYWQRAASMNPSLFTLNDYLEYMSDRNMPDPLLKHQGQRPVFGFEEIQTRYSAYPSTILSRSRIFMFNSDGSSRAICEDIVYVRLASAAARWGEYKIPYSGRFKPVRVRVYSSSGEVTESFSVQKADGGTYLNIANLSEKSILSISYILDNPVTSPRGSSMFSIPASAVQGYDEPLASLFIKVIVPEDMKVNFFMNEPWEVVRSSLGAKAEYSVKVTDIKARHRENFSGSALNVLPFFSISTMDGFKDFVEWYSGLASISEAIPADFVDEGLRGKTIDSTVQRVYDYTARKINLAGTVLYYPDRPENTAYNRSATAENKVHFAKALLGKFGIRSYVAFARNRLLPASDQYPAPDVFSDILLYVPVDINRGIWLDFGSSFLPCGTVRGGLNGVDALVILGGNYTFKKIVSADPGIRTISYRIDLDERGGARFDFKASYSGIYGEARRYFRNRDSIEENINSVVSNIFANASVEKFSLENGEDYSRPFILQASGESQGISTLLPGRLILQPVLNKSNIYNYANLPERSYPLYIVDAVHDIEDYVYRLPDAFKSYALKSESAVKRKFGSVFLKFAKTRGSNELSVEKRIKLNPGRILPEDYREFAEFCQELKRMEYQNIIINGAD